MKRLILSAYILITCYAVRAQTVHTILPAQPIISGTAFQVQYIITHPAELLSTVAPSFDSFQVVSGPNQYKGNAVVEGKLQPIVNVTYTLVSQHTGRKKIKALKAVFKSGEMESTENFVDVVPQPKVSFSPRSSYTDISLYAPPSRADLKKMVDDNLFLRVSVDKKTCYVGEPVVASFKLYSRLQSSSEMVKTPALYGFSVADMVSTNEAHQSVETIHGAVFNTSLLRKVQLYPEQAGLLTIDEMLVHNEIEFDDSVHGGKTSLEKELTSEPVTIRVKPLPGRKPENFSGAIGAFSLSAHLQQEKLEAGREGKLVVRVSGKGNFIQFSQPSVSWIKEAEVFEPAISDRLALNQVPMEGTRDYVIGFTIDRPGRYVLPPVQFSFFDTASGSFKTLSTETLKLEVIQKKEEPKKAYIKRERSAVWIWFAVALALLTCLWFFLRRKKIRKASVLPPAPPAAHPLDNILVPDISAYSSKGFCAEIQKTIARLNASGILMTAEQQGTLRHIAQECQLMAYSDINAEDRKEVLLQQLKDLLAELKR